MMIKSKKNKIIALVLVLFLAVTAFITTLVLTFNKSPISVQAAVVEGWDTSQSISVGSPVDIPETAKVTVNGEDATIDNIYIVYPNGTVKVYGDYPLGMVGEYVMLFEGTHDGEPFSAAQKFVVTNNSYMFSNSESSVTYTKLDDLADDIVYEMTADGNGDLTVLTNMGNKKDLLTARGVLDGVISASLEQNDTLKIGKIVNLYDLADENGNVDVCSFIPGNYTPVDEGNKVNNNIDTHYSLVKVVDAHDPSNYVEFYIWAGTNKRASGEVNYNDYYVGAGAGNQVMRGISPTTPEYFEKNPTIDCRYIGNEIYRVFTAERYATSLVHGKHVNQDKYGNQLNANKGILYKSGLYTDSLMYLSFNVEENKCYVNNMFVNDLDDSVLYPNGNEQFKGFTTGEVYIQFEHAYSNAYAINFEIASIFNMSGDALKNSEVVDNTKPIIKLDVEKTTETGIIIKNGKEFTLPSAQVIDVNKTGKYNVELYYNYETASQVWVGVSNGKFTPNKAGVYTAVYSTIDAYGNSSEKTILEIVSSDEDVITNDGNALDALEAGKVNIIPSQNPKTLNKYVNERVAIVYPDGTRVDFTHAKTSGGYEIIPEYVGSCKIEYTFTDNVDSAVFSYNVTSSGENVYFKDSLAIPTYMIKDACYDIDKYFVYAPSATGENPMQAEIYYSVDGGAESKIDNQHKFTVPAGAKIDFRAKYGEQYSSVYSTKIVDLAFATNSKDYKNYWQGYKAVKVNYDSMEYTMDSNSTLSFVTPISLGAFAIKYKVDDSVKLNAYSIKISGIANKDEGLVITYARLANRPKELTYTVSDLHGKVYYTGAVSGLFGEEKNLTVTADYYLVSGENVRVKIPEFESRNVEIKFDFTGATGEFNLKISKVCNQAFNGNMKPRSEAKAQVVYRSIYKEYFKGDVCRLPNFNVSSALYPTSLSDLKITITATDGGYIAKDANGNDINGLVVEFGKDYSFKIDAVTTYKTKFIYKDKEDNIEGAYSVKSKDNQKPTVSFVDYDGEGIETVDLNTKYKFRDYTVADDFSPEADLYVAFSVYNYKGDLEYWGEGAYFTFAKAGTYKILIFCQDVEGNYATASYEVEVE